MERLLDNYQKSAQQRLSRWFGPDARIERDGCCLLAIWGQRSACLTFLAPSCRWRLIAGDLEQVGSFDRMTKRVRQLFSASAKEEEGERLTRTVQSRGIGIPVLGEG